MKKNILYLAVLAIVAAIGFLVFKQKKAGMQVSSDQNFAVAHVDSIDRIVLENKTAKAELRREGDHWRINDRYKAMQPKVDKLLETIKKVQVEYPVAKAAMENADKELTAKATKVEIYRKGESSPFKVYYVGGVTTNSKGTFMRMESAEQIYAMTVPGHIGLLDVRYFTEEIEWRDTGIFDYDMDDIAQVSVQYPQHPDSSFTLKVVNADSVELTPTIAVPGPKKISKERVAKYLTSFSFLNAEMYDNDNPKKDSISSSTPFASVVVTDRSGISKQMTVYYMPLNRRSKSQFDEKGDYLPYDLDKYYAVINDGKDFVVIQDFVFGKIFRRYSDFLVGQQPT